MQDGSFAFRNPTLLKPAKRCSAMLPTAAVKSIRPAFGVASMSLTKLRYNGALNRNCMNNCFSFNFVGLPGSTAHNIPLNAIPVPFIRANVSANKFADTALISGNFVKRPISCNAWAPCKLETDCIKLPFNQRQIT